MRLAWLTGALVLVSTILTQKYFQRHERTALEMRLREKATFINNFYAFLVADALQHNDDVTLLQVVNRLEEDPEITSVVVVDGQGEVRYDADPEMVGTVLDDKVLKTALKTGEGLATNFTNAGGQALALVAPLKIRGQSTPMGALRIEFTYRHIMDQVHTGQSSFQMMAMGTMLFSVGGILWGCRRWVMMPLTRLRAVVMSINPALLESNLPESDDEFGQINTSLNEMLAKLKTEWGNQRAALATQPSDERILIEGLVRALIPEERVLLIDRDNRVVCDTGRENGFDSGEAPHLLDLITDTSFANLMGIAVQSGGDVARGPLVFQDQPYDATIVALREGQSKNIRAIIALKTIPDIRPKKEAV